MKLDAGLGAEGRYLRAVDRTARAAEDLGFAGLWTSETKHDAFLPLAIAANETREIELGTSVAIAFSRSPMETAQTAWDLQDLSGGRFVLGLGTQVKAHITRRFSMPWEKPAARLREYILAVREIWDGFHVHPFHSPEYVRRTVIPAITAGAEGVGRDPDQVTLATSAFVITGENREETKERRESVRAQISFYASTPTYRTVLEAHGWEEVGEKLGTMAREKKWREMPAFITDEMLAAFAIEAAPDEIGSALKERYEGLIDRVALYLPFVTGEHDEFWERVVDSAH